MIADWTGCVLLTCVTVSLGQLACSTKLTQQVAVNAQSSPTHTHTHTANAHTSTTTYASARITVREVNTSTLCNPHACANNFLSPGDKGEGRRRRKGGGGNAGDDGGDSSCLFIWNIFSEGNGAGKSFFLLLRWWIYCANKKRICIEDPCLIAIEKPKTWWDVNLQRSSLFFSSVWLWEVSKLTLRFLI